MKKISSAFEKVRNHQAMERMKMLVGMDVDEESAPVTTTSEESSFAFMDDFNRHWPTSMLVFFNPIKFGITFTLGNLLSIGSTAFLIGPKRQITMMLDPVRIFTTALYLASMIVALLCALYVHNKFLTLLAIILEFGALT